MNQLFDPVSFEATVMPWDYGIRTVHDFKGYYHWHQCCEMLFVHEGQGSIVLNRQAYDIRRGMLFMFQPFQLHHVHAEVSPTTPYVRSIFYMDPNLFEENLRPFPRRHAMFMSLWQDRNRNHAYDLSAQVEAMEWIYAAYNQARVQGKGEEAEEMTLLLLQILNCIESVNGYEKQPAKESIAPRTLRYSETIMKWIEDHYQEEVSLDRLAEETHLSKSYVSRIFRQETGSSITDYLTARRIKKACRLLESTDWPVEQIAIQAGIPNSSYFIQLFKRVVGTTPFKYRNNFEKYRVRQDE